MYWIPVIIVAIILFIYQLLNSRKWLRVVVPTALCAIIMGISVAIDYSAQTSDIEVWSGHVEEWKHTEEWDEYHPPVTTCTTDSNGKKSCTTRPGYWEHHPAENELKTTDRGWFHIYYTPEGKRMNDRFPNRTAELEEMFPKGTPTASRHRYTNKLQASYSIYRHEDIDLKDFPDLPKYPDKIRDELYVDRLIGKVPKEKEANKELSKLNTYLNKRVPDSERPGKTRSYKEVNVIFVNVGKDKSREYGFALQDYWQGGNKNDFVIAFSMNEKGSVSWAYPFSWSESELLKIETRQYMEDLKKVKDFKPVVKDIGKLVEDKYKRKEFADFNYLQINVSTTANVIIWILSFVTAGVAIYLDLAGFELGMNSRRYYR